MPKQLVRKKLLQQRKQCASGLCRTLSREIQERFLTTSAYARAGCLALYAAIHNEVETDLVAEAALAAGKELVYPRVAEDRLLFVRTADPTSLKPGFFKVPEPPAGEVVSVEIIDLCVVPGVAFDLQGHRLGYGRGYYDRFLAECSARTERVGFAYDFQVVETLPAQPHDQMLTMLITEQRMLDLTRRPATPATAHQ